MSRGLHVTPDEARTLMGEKRPPGRVARSTHVTVGWPLRLTIPGNPVIKKNHRPIFINPRTGRPFPGKSDSLRDWEREAVTALKEQSPALELAIPLVATFLIFRKQSPEAPGDQSNYYEAPQDALQAAGIIQDDRFIRSYGWQPGAAG